MGAPSAAADEHDEGFAVHLLLQLLGKIWVGLAIRVGGPFHLDGPGNATHPVELGAGANIHQPRARCVPLQLMGFPRRKRPTVRKPEILCSLPRRREYVVDGSHGGNIPNLKSHHLTLLIVRARSLEVQRVSHSGSALQE